MTPAEGEQRARLLAIVHAAPWFMRALRAGAEAARDLGLGPRWCIGAGALRNLVWDHLHGRPASDVPPALADVDFAFFDPLDLTPARDAAVQAALARLAPDLPWEATNQAGVHLWFESTFGHAAEPLVSLEDGVASWPETATAAALRLGCDGGLHLIAPLGLDDLLAGVVRRNPRRVSVQTYRERCATKRYGERWPQVRVVPA